jgi:hypothetical protein
MGLRTGNKMTIEQSSPCPSDEHSLLPRDVNAEHRKKEGFIHGVLASREIRKTIHGLGETHF